MTHVYAHSPHHLPKKVTPKQPVNHIGSSDEPPKKKTKTFKTKEFHSKSGKKSFQWSAESLQKNSREGKIFRRRIKVLRNCLSYNIQITINALNNQDFVKIMPLVKRPGLPPDVTALMVTKEIDVSSVLRDFREGVVKNVPRATTEIVVVIFDYLLVQLQENTILGHFALW